MVTVQPGKVPTYTPDPAVSLTNYSDADRTRFLHVGSQFVKARLVASRASYAYVGYYAYSSSTLVGSQQIDYTSYKTLSGDYALIDGSTSTPQATGAPLSGKGEVVVVGYPVQVSTDTVTLYSPSFFDFYELFKVRYSHNGSDYFDITTDSVDYEYTGGVYVFSINLTTTVTGRYFKISAYATTVTTATFTDDPASFTVADTSDFPSSWTSMGDIYVYGKFDSHPLGMSHYTSDFTYTGKTGTSFTGVTLGESNPGDDVEVGARIYTLFSFGDIITEVDVVGITEPVLQFWDKGSGSQGTSKALQHDFYYDVIYDKDKGVYLSVRLNNDLDGTGGSGFSYSDNFDDTSTGSNFNTTRWSESTSYPNFQHNTSSGTAEYLNTSAAGELNTNYYLSDDFTVAIDVGFNRVTSSGARVSLMSIEDDTDNVFTQVGFTGPYFSGYSGAPSGKWEALRAYESSNTSGGRASIASLRLDTRYLPDGAETYEFTYDSVSDIWTVASGSGGALGDLQPGISYNEGPLNLSIVHSDSVPNGSQIVLDVNTQHSNLPAFDGSQWSWKLGLSRVGTNLKCQYDVGSGLVDWITYPDLSSGNLNVGLYADGGSLSVIGGTPSIDLSLDNFVVTGNAYFSNVPVLTLEAVNSAGNVTVVPSFTDGDGYVIKRWDLFNESTLYNEYINGKVQLATDGLPGGNIYLKLGTDLYKYSKGAFPLDLEYGDSATLVVSGTLPELTAESFSFNSYSNGALCYVEYDDVRSGTYLKTVDITTLSGTEYEVFLDVSGSDYPWAWDIDNYNTLYYIDSTNEKLYDLDEDDVAFCNITSAEKIMAAGTSSTSTVTATVLNAYGEPLSAKTVTFTVSAGTGSLSPSVSCTSASGTASTTYTVGSTVGETILTASASDASC